MSRNIIYLFTAVLLITACSPPGGETTRVELSDLAGLWNSSESHGAKTDLLYTRITRDGGIIEYDYDGDEVDQGLNCYQIESGWIKPVDGSRFLVAADMYTGEQFEVELELLDNGHALKVYFMDSENPAKTIKSQIWTREADASLLDSEPSCKK